MKRILLLSVISICMLGVQAWASILDKDTATALVMLQQGRINESMAMLKKSAAANAVVAQYYLAVCYEQGLGMEKDEKMAFSMYRRAAERGFVPAMDDLSRCYSNGIGVTANNDRAGEWVERSRRRKFDEEIPDIAQIYQNALTVANPSEASQSTPETLMASTQNTATVSGHTTTRPAALPIRQKENATPQNNTRPPLSDVDTDIPGTSITASNTFAFIIANEHYQDVMPVAHAINDGEVFAKYCTKTLGLPKTNVHLIKDATLNNIKREINLMKQIAQAYEGEAEFIVYYAGHGVPDEATRNAFLLPIDGFGSDLSTCLSVNELYQTLGKLPSSKIILFMDACFSGARRDGNMLTAARGVAIKAKSGMPEGNTLVVASAQGDETAYSYDEKRHGLFTYYLLKKLKESNGNVDMGSLVEYIRQNVTRQSLVIKSKSQTPVPIPSSNITARWQNWKLK